MSFADWTFIKDGGNGAAAWESIGPIEGTHSYSVNDSTNTTTHYAVGLIAGVSAECGRCRVMNKQVNGNIANWGVFANVQSSFAMGSNAYTVTYVPSSGAVIVQKATLLDASSVTGTGVVATGTWGGAAQALNDVFAMQLEWQRVASSGSVVLTASLYGPIASPSTFDWTLLQTMAAYTDPTSPFTSGVTSGFQGLNGGGGVGTPTRKMYDLIYIYTD